jgi:hypothetical protein
LATTLFLLFVTGGMPATQETFDVKLKGNPYAETLADQQQWNFHQVCFIVNFVSRRFMFLFMPLCRRKRRGPGLVIPTCPEGFSNPACSAILGIPTSFARYARGGVSICSLSRQQVRLRRAAATETM